jgi:ketosteroid isomerase-like protein
MRKLAIVIVLCTLFPNTSLAQSTRANSKVQDQIRALEQAQVAALLRNDIAAMKRNWATDFIVNNPFNVAVDASKGPIQAGTLTYSSFERKIERVLVRGNVVIVMGSETVVPSGKSADAGKTIHRRFTDVWMNRGGRWLLTARHANVVCNPTGPPN